MDIGDGHNRSSSNSEPACTCNHLGCQHHGYGILVRIYNAILGRVALHAFVVIIRVALHFRPTGMIPRVVIPRSHGTPE